jgi:CRISPR-associated protein Csd1
VNSARIAVAYYKEFDRSKYVENIGKWHKLHAWNQKGESDKITFYGSPSLEEIALCAYKYKDKTHKSDCIKDLVLCVVMQRKIPSKYIHLCHKRLLNKKGSEAFSWDKRLRILCGLITDDYENKEKIMKLDRSNNSRDYLFGRIYSTIEKLEGYNNQRDGKGSRAKHTVNMLRNFVGNPSKTLDFLLTELYRVLNKREFSLYRKEMDEIMGLFQEGDYSNDKLTHNWWLGYYAQREYLKERVDELVQKKAGQKKGE